MTSTRLMIILIIEYMIIAGWSGYESNWWRCLYYLAAAVLTVAVIGMSEK